MTALCLKHIEETIAQYGWRGLDVLDVGGRNVNGAAGPLWGKAGCDYTVADIWAAPGVNFCVAESGEWTIPRSFDVVTSCCTLEHVRRPWVLARTLGRHVKPRGWLYLIAPFSWPYHRFPVDCWRLSPDGMAVLFEEAGVSLKRCELLFEERSAWTSARNVWGWMRYVVPAVLGGRQVNRSLCAAVGRKEGAGKERTGASAPAAEAAAVPNEKRIWADPQIQKIADYVMGKPGKEG